MNVYNIGSLESVLGFQNRSINQLTDQLLLQNVPGMNSPKSKIKKHLLLTNIVWQPKFDACETITTSAEFKIHTVKFLKLIPEYQNVK